MQKIQIVGAEGIDPEKIERFEGHIKYLLANTYIRKGIAQRMGKQEGNISKILNGKLSVSHAFIEDFYQVFGAELPDESVTGEGLGEYHLLPRTLIQTIHAIKKDTEAIRLHLNIKDDDSTKPPDDISPEGNSDGTAR
ncbi:MAG TPA: hypothetical protein VGS79_01545 [Puia sp.]|nr:hypothetical protein [Puia sp.]